MDLNRTIEKYNELGYINGDIIYDPHQNVNVCVLDYEILPKIEFLAPPSGDLQQKKSPVETIL